VYTRCTVDENYQSHGLLPWLLRKHVAIWQHSKISTGQDDGEKKRLTTIVQVNDAITMHALVGEYGFQVYALVRLHKLKPFTIEQHLAETEQQKLLRAVNMFSPTAQPIAYQWPSILRDAGINSQHFAELERSTTKGDRNGKTELEHAYMLLSPDGEWKTPAHVEGHAGAKRKAGVSRGLLLYVFHLYVHLCPSFSNTSDFKAEAGSSKKRG